MPLTENNFLAVLSASAETESGIPWKPHRICKPAVRTLFAEPPAPGLRLYSLLTKQDLRMFLECGRHSTALTLEQKEWGYSCRPRPLSTRYWIEQPSCSNPCPVVFARKCLACHSKIKSLAVQKDYQHIPCSHIDAKHLAEGFTQIDAQAVAWGIRDRRTPVWYEPYLYIRSPRRDIRISEWATLATYIHIYENVPVAVAVRRVGEASHNEIKQFRTHAAEIESRIYDWGIVRLPGISKAKGIALFHAFPSGSVAFRIIPNRGEVTFALRSPWANISAGEILALGKMLSTSSRSSWASSLKKLAAMSDEERLAAHVALRLVNS